MTHLDFPFDDYDSLSTSERESDRAFLGHHQRMAQHLSQHPEIKAIFLGNGPSQGRHAKAARQCRKSQEGQILAKALKHSALLV